MMNWQPIETVPKNPEGSLFGPPVLVKCETNSGHGSFVMQGRYKPRKSGLPCIEVICYGTTSNGLAHRQGGNGSVHFSEMEICKDCQIVSCYAVSWCHL